MSDCLHVTHFPAGSIMSVFRMIMASRYTQSASLVLDTHHPSGCMQLAEAKPQGESRFKEQGNRLCLLGRETSSGKKHRHGKGRVIWVIDAINPLFAMPSLLYYVYL